MRTKFFYASIAANVLAVAYLAYIGYNAYKQSEVCNAENGCFTITIDAYRTMLNRAYAIGAHTCAKTRAEEVRFEHERVESPQVFGVPKNHVAYF